tara:strand:+ start:1284 stop:1454 length:171 start_codon:yes stop_codon:yes gene_type:complete
MEKNAKVLENDLPSLALAICRYEGKTGTAKQLQTCGKNWQYNVTAMYSYCKLRGLV